MNDKVNHPKHYTQGDVECIEAIEAALTPDEFIGYLRGSIMKYIWRCRDKNGHEDVEKCGFYRDLLAERFLGKREQREEGFLFPAISELPMSFDDQMEKISEEVRELGYEEQEYWSEFSFWRKPNTENMKMESMDVIHACETLLRMLHVTDREYAELRQAVEDKNRARGYYGDEG